jgi:hypothetical protein
VARVAEIHALPCRGKVNLAGLSVRVSLSDGPGDPSWTQREARRLAELEARFNPPGTVEWEASR